MGKLYHRRNVVRLAVAVAGGGLFATARISAAQSQERTMSNGSNAEAIRSLIQRFFNGHNPSVANEYFAPDFKWHGGSVGSYQGAENYAVAMAGFFRGLPDVHAVEQDLIESGDTVAARFVVEGTHLGELWGVQPTGRRIRWDATMIYRMADGKVSEQWAAEDWAAILHGMGLVRLPWLK